VEGPLLLAEAISAGWAVEAQFVAPGADAFDGIPVHRLAPGVLERVASTEHPQGLLAVVRCPTEVVDLEQSSFVLVAANIGDPGNLGTLMRSAEASGVDTVVVTPGTVDRFNPKVVRSSAGALFHVRSTVASLGDVAAAGLRVIGTSSHHGTPHTTLDWSGRVAIVMGNEAHGVPEDAAVGDWVTIRHHGRAESLNVAMAATVLCFEAASRRGPVGGIALDRAEGDA
jgi:RNA methyltransferase, TrmH family